MQKCSKKNNESFVDYRDRVLNPISNSFCGAKWYNATIWLGNGRTASCHHPPSHRIPLNEVIENYKAIHNTLYKKQIRKEMLEGVRPKECEYCWKIEDLGCDKVSDRVHKSLIYSEEELIDAKNKLGWDQDVDLKTLEIAFDSICNLACSYCGPVFSTAWSKDIEQNGPYVNLVSDGSFAYQKDGSVSMPFGSKNEGNPYVDAFWLWWEKDLKSTLRELRITGGEPLISPNFWRLLKWWEGNDDCEVELAVNSNLCSKENLIDNLIASTLKIKSFHLYTSCEAIGMEAEYIRDGFKWEAWLSNLEKFIISARFKSINCMLTINALCMFSVTDLLDEMIKLKVKHQSIFPVCSFNILRFPSFMSVLTLPKSIRLERAAHLENWLNQIEQSGCEFFTDWEKDGVKRLIAYLESIEEGHSKSSPLEMRQRDIKNFFSQYDKRRGKNFIETFPKLKDWWETILIE
jgi:organic radical activating enzyme